MTLARRTGVTDQTGELHLLVELGDAPSPSRIARDIALSLAVHGLIIGFLVALPEVERTSQAPLVVPDVKKAVTIVAPRFTELTQKDPNKGKATKSLDVRSAVSAPRQQVASTQPPPRVPSPPVSVPAPAPVPPPAPAPVPAATPAPEPPKIEIAANVPSPAPGNSPQPTPPPEKAKPKLAFESPTAASIQSSSTNPALNLPRTSVQDLARASSPSGGSGGISVGDPVSNLPDPTMGQAPSPGHMGSNLQLMSDPNGVDFKPYLIQVLAAVRHNWMSVVPESARLGRRGQVLVQFIIDRQGTVPKLVIASTSGAGALDRAAVAGITSSLPFPPLPASYKGTEIRLQLAFSYNMSR